MILQVVKRYLKEWFHKPLLTVLTFLLFAGLLNLMLPPAIFAQPVENTALEITGDGVTTPLKLTMEQLEAMEQYQHVYSVINTYPTKKWYIGKGVRLRELLILAGFKEEEAQLIRFVSSDDYEVTLTVKELLKDTRYYFPGLKDNHVHDGSIPGSSEGKLEVEPILALLSAEGSDNPDNMNDRDSLHLLLGQRAVTEQTCNLFLKYVSKIEVLTTAPEKWDAPKTNMPDGTAVPEGTMLKLRNKLSDADKIYYTTDGSTPTVNSPMYNWIAKRWHPLRPDDLDLVNCPFEITEDTVIKAITIGPGKEDSEVVTFTFTVDPTAVDPTKIPGGPPTGVTLDRDTINLNVGSTFQLEASVAPFNADDQKVTWSSSDTRVATVDNRGLVTVVGPGTAVITAKTEVGGHTAICIINDPGGESSGQVVVPDSPPPEDEVLEDPAELPVPKDHEQYHAEGEEAVPDLAATAGEAPETAGEASEAADESFVPEDRRRYLVEKKNIAVTSTNADISAEQPAVYPWQVFEMSVDTTPLLLEERKGLAVYEAALFLIFFFFSGASKRYIEYVKEL